MNDREKIDRILQVLAEEPEYHFPKRMDEMTPTEAEIAKIACELRGTLLYIEKVLKEK
jgi:hypothetical protein